MFPIVSKLDLFAGGADHELRLRESIEEALGLWASVAPLHFVEVADEGTNPPPRSAYPNGQFGQIRFHHIYMNGPDIPGRDPIAKAQAYFPSGGGNLGGDVYFDHEGLGRLPDHRLLPADMKPGDVLALLNCGAYSLAQAMQYNGRFLPPVVLIKENGEPELVRRRETFEDLIASDL